MAKTIVFCADGTWNNPYEDETADHPADPTNVYKLFLCLAGSLSYDSLLNADEQEKTLAENGLTRQVAKYLHGVGDSRNPINKLLGGAFGAGIISRIVRGYTFLSRNFAPGDDIVIVGFSRGAYTARALAGLIASQGLLSPQITDDRERAYRSGAEAWYRYRQTTMAKPSGLAHLAEIVSNLPAFVSSRSLKDGDFTAIDRIASVAVWDTVGAMGFPDYEGRGNRVDAFKFVNTQLSRKVGHGFHAVALDERRDDFKPTLWDPAANVVQILFPGAHADVGGGYPAAHGESGLSDGALKWMLANLAQVGVNVLPSPPCSINPDPQGTAHKPWAHAPWNLPGISLGPRSFPAGMQQDPSIAARMAASSVVNEPGEPPAPYRPTNLPV
ncbi:MAG: DUF2235 domain-containing protein [Nitrospiraceae bacterium]